MSSNQLNIPSSPEDKTNNPQGPIFPTVEASEIAKGISERLSKGFDEIFGNEQDKDL